MSSILYCCVDSKLTEVSKFEDSVEAMAEHSGS